MKIKIEINVHIYYCFVEKCLINEEKLFVQKLYSASNQICPYPTPSVTMSNIHIRQTGGHGKKNNFTLFKIFQIGLVINGTF